MIFPGCNPWKVSVSPNFVCFYVQTYIRPTSSYVQRKKLAQALVHQQHHNTKSCSHFVAFCCNWQVSGDIKSLETALELAYIDLSGTKVQGPQMLATNFSCLIFAANELLVTAIWMFVLYCLGILKLLFHLASNAHRSQRNKQHPVPFFLKLTEEIRIRNMCHQLHWRNSYQILAVP